jgi:hypothetical protein
MRRNNYRALASLLAPLIFCAGCFPFHYTTRPGVQGIVVDQSTQSPITNNVSVSLASFYGYWDETNKVHVCETNIITTANTDLAGTFKIRPAKKWGIYIVPMDVFSRPYELIISRTNYELKKIEFSHNPMATGKGATVQLGNIQLIPEK